MIHDGENPACMGHGRKAERQREPTEQHTRHSLVDTQDTYINGTMNTQCGTKTTIVPLDSKHYIRVAVPVPTPSGRFQRSSRPSRDRAFGNGNFDKSGGALACELAATARQPPVEARDRDAAEARAQKRSCRARTDSDHR